MKGLKQKIIQKKIIQELKIKEGIVEIDKSSCDGCKQCLNVCPHSAITIINLSKEEVKKLSLKGRLKVKIKGNNKASINQEICTACGLCIKQCHEFAIHKRIKK